MAKGDIVLITFPFINLSGTKLRPSLVLTESVQDATVCFITSQMQWQETTDIVLPSSTVNGLRKVSLVRTSKIATLDKGLIRGFMGKLTVSELNVLDTKLKLLFNL